LLIRGLVKDGTTPSRYGGGVGGGGGVDVVVV